MESSFGAKGWGYREVLPYFIKSENNSDLNIIRNNPGYHGREGPLGVTTDPNPQPILLLGMKAFNELGLETVDINGAKQLGTTINQSTIKNGLRSSTGNAYIDPNPHPNNLDILIGAFVTKILIERTDEENLRANGVIFVKNNVFYEVNAKREVIISAGICILI